MPVSVRVLRERIRAREEDIFQSWTNHIDEKLADYFDGKEFKYGDGTNELQVEFVHSEKDMFTIPVSNLVNHVVSVYTSYGQGWNVQVSTTRAYDRVDDRKVTFTFTVAEETAEPTQGGTP